MLLTTRVDDEAEHTLIVVEGELDLATAGQLRDVVSSCIAQSQRPLMLDLAKLRFCDSAGLAVFVSAYNELEALGRGWSSHLPPTRSYASLS